VHNNNYCGYQILLTFLLLLSMFSVNAAKIHDAAKKGNLILLKQLVQLGSKVDLKHEYAGETALHLASKKEHMDSVKYLIASRALINMKDRYYCLA